MTAETIRYTVRCDRCGIVHNMYAPGTMSYYNVLSTHDWSNYAEDGEVRDECPECRRLTE